MSENLTKEFFAENVNTTFRVRLDSAQSLEVELVEMNSNDQLQQKGVENFSVVFRGPRELFLPQRTYRMEHERAGEFDIFIVPIRGDTAGYYYEAVFNRLVD